MPTMLVPVSTRALPWPERVRRGRSEGLLEPRRSRERESARQQVGGRRESGGGRVWQAQRPCAERGVRCAGAAEHPRRYEA